MYFQTLHMRTCSYSFSSSQHTPTQAIVGHESLINPFMLKKITFAQVPPLRIACFPCSTPTSARNKSKHTVFRGRTYKYDQV